MSYNFYLKILILLTLMTQTSSATMDYFLTYYISNKAKEHKINCSFKEIRTFAVGFKK